MMNEEIESISQTDAKGVVLNKEITPMASSNDLSREHKYLVNTRLINRKGSAENRTELNYKPVEPIIS